MSRIQSISKSVRGYLVFPILVTILVGCSSRDESIAEESAASTAIQKKDPDSSHENPTKAKCCEQAAKPADARVAEDLLLHIAESVSDGDAQKAEKALEELHRELSHQTENGPPAQNATRFDDAAFLQLSRDLVAAIRDKRADARTRYDELKDFVARILAPE
jgi:hypothetical protein